MLLLSWSILSQVSEMGAPGMQEKNAIGEVFCQFPDRFARQFKGKGHEVSITLHVHYSAVPFQKIGQSKSFTQPLWESKS